MDKDIDYDKYCTYYRLHSLENFYDAPTFDEHDALHQREFLIDELPHDIKHQLVCLAYQHIDNLEPEEIEARKRDEN